ncbi:MAG: hypothetical protein AB1938_04925 [Myxococcota bacterium]
MTLLSVYFPGVGLFWLGRYQTAVRWFLVLSFSMVPPFLPWLSIPPGGWWPRWERIGLQP